VSRPCLSALLVLALSIGLAGPALAGETIEGDGYQVRIPDGFTELMSIENTGNMHVTSRFGNLPMDGMPELKAYTRGDARHPDGLIILARVNLTRSITSARELGLGQIERMRERLPEGADVHATKVGSHDALEIRAPHESEDGDRTMHVLSVAAGDYVVVLSMDTSDETLGDSGALWQTMVASLEVEPGMNKLLLFGLIGLVGLLALFLLGKVGSRNTSATPDYTGRFKRFQEGGIGTPDTTPGFPPREHAEYGRRPRVLPARPAPFAGDAPTAPARTPTSPAVTRPAPHATPPRPGLKATRPHTGRWGE